MSSVADHATVSITGCPTISDNTDYATALLCMSRGTASHVLSSYKMKSTEATQAGLTPVISITPTSSGLRKQTLPKKSQS